MKNTKMFRFVLISIMVVFTGLGFTAEQLKGTKLAEYYNSIGIVKVFQNEEDTEHCAEGTGFFIAKDKVVTNSHVVENKAKAQFETHDGEVHNVKSVYASDFKNDLVILQLEKEVENARSIKFAKEAAQPGDKLFTIGHPNGLYYSYSEGVASASRNDEGLENTLQMLENTLQMTVPISMGSSGGPVLNETGELVGVISFYMEGGQNLNFAISKEVLEAMKENQMSLADYSMNVQEQLYGMIDEAYAKVNKALMTDDTNTVYSVVEELLGKYPEKTDVKMFAAEIFSMIGESDSAYEMISGLDTSMFYDDPYSYFSLGNTCYSVGKYGEAEEYLKKAAELGTDMAYTYELLSDCYAKRHKIEAALNNYKMGIYLFPDDIYIKVAFVKFLNDIEAHDEALKYIEKYTQDGEGSDYLYEEIRALKAKREYEKTLEKIELYEEQVAKQQEMYDNMSFSNEGYDMEGTSGNDSELEDSNVMVMAVPMGAMFGEEGNQSKEITSIKADCLYALDRKEEAFEILDKAMADSENVEFSKKAADLKLREKDYAAAKQYLTKALTVKSDDVTVHEKLAECYKQLGKEMLYRAELKILKELK